MSRKLVRHIAFALAGILFGIALPMDLGDQDVGWWVPALWTAFGITLSAGLIALDSVWDAIGALAVLPARAAALGPAGNPYVETAGPRSTLQKRGAKAPIPRAAPDYDRRAAWLRPLQFRVSPPPLNLRIEYAIDEGRELLQTMSVGAEIDALKLYAGTSPEVKAAGFRPQVDAWMKRTLEGLADDVTPRFVEDFTASLFFLATDDLGHLRAELSARIAMLEELRG